MRINRCVHILRNLPRHRRRRPVRTTGALRLTYRLRFPLNRTVLRPLRRNRGRSLDPNRLTCKRSLNLLLTRLAGIRNLRWSRFSSSLNLLLLNPRSSSSRFNSRRRDRLRCSLRRSRRENLKFLGGRLLRCLLSKTYLRLCLPFLRLRRCPSCYPNRNKFNRSKKKNSLWNRSRILRRRLTASRPIPA